jgi:hypothetical protein
VGIFGVGFEEIGGLCERDIDKIIALFDERLAEELMKIDS